MVKVQQGTKCFIESGLWSTTNLSQHSRETENLPCCFSVSKVENAKAKHRKGSAADATSLTYLSSFVKHGEAKETFSEMLWWLHAEQ